ncbi:MAG: 1-phosphofructokinase family hexose kinase, partial [Actinomycetota bacterium]
MIVTLTPNPSLDQTLEVDALRRGEINRAQAFRLDPGGKGVNVSRALVANGHTSRAVLPLGGTEGERLASLLRDMGIEVVPVSIDDAIRTNLTVVEPDGTVTKINAPGPTLSASEADGLLERTIAAVDGGRWVVASGSLSPGMADDFYA